MQESLACATIRATDQHDMEGTNMAPAIAPPTRHSDVVPGGSTA